MKIRTLEELDMYIGKYLDAFNPPAKFNPWHAPAGTPEGGQFTSGEYAGDPTSGNYTVTHSSAKDIDKDAEITSGGKMQELYDAIEGASDEVLNRVKQNASPYYEAYIKDPIGFEVAINTAFRQQLGKLFPKYKSVDYWAKNQKGQRGITGFGPRDYDDIVKVLFYQAKAILENSAK